MTRALNCDPSTRVRKNVVMARPSIQHPYSATYGIPTNRAQRSAPAPPPNTRDVRRHQGMRRTAHGSWPEHEWWGNRDDRSDRARLSRHPPAASREAIGVRLENVSV